MKIVVYHTWYGCDTGCCGHAVAVDPKDPEFPYDDQKWGSFDFIHPYGDDPRQFAESIVRKEMGDEHVADLDWEHCLIIDC